MKSIKDWMIEKEIALSTWQAGHIYEGLKLWKCKSFEEQTARVLLYRRWRPKTDVKNDIPAWQAYDLAIAGIDPDDVVERQIEIDEVITKWQSFKIIKTEND